MATYHRTVFTIEVLSPDRYDPFGLEQIAYDIDEGECSGGPLTIIVREEVDAATMADLLEAQASDPEFLLTEEDLAQVRPKSADN